MFIFYYLGNFDNTSKNGEILRMNLKTKKSEILDRNNRLKSSRNLNSPSSTKPGSSTRIYNRKEGLSALQSTKD